MDIVDLPVVDKVEVTTLCENLVDNLLPNKGPVQRLRSLGHDPMRSSLMVAELQEPFAAAHGLSVLVRITKDGITRTVLFDAGGTPRGANAQPRLSRNEPEGLELHCLVSRPL